MAATGLREHATSARSTSTFGRVMVSSRDQHLVVDGPVQNGCPGEAITPGEMFLGGVASCGVELVQVIARELGIVVEEIALSVRGIIDRGHPVRPDLALFNAVHLMFEIHGVGDDEAATLVDTFKGR